MPVKTMKAVTPTYRGPPTFRIPVTIKNVQDWHILPSVLGSSAKECQKNREPPFTETVVPCLEKLFEVTLELYRNREEA